MWGKLPLGYFRRKSLLSLQKICRLGLVVLQVSVIKYSGKNLETQELGFIFISEEKKSVD
jgi:hypothetical protein